MTAIKLDIPTFRRLLVDWVARFARDEGIRFTQFGKTGQAYTLGPTGGFHLTARFIEDPPFLAFVASDPSIQSEVDRLVGMAVTKSQTGEFGGVVWYSTEVHELPFALNAASWMSSLLQRLGNQVRIVGLRRLGSGILLEFSEVTNDGQAEATAQPLVPPAMVRVHIAAPGPIAGQFAAHVAHGVIEIVTAICTFALGRPMALPHGLFPSNDERVRDIESHRLDPAVGTLARKGVGLDVFSLAALPGGLDVARRLQASLITFDAAVHQERDSVASILYVVSAESLTVPNASWRHGKLTKRFREFFDELIPDQLDAIVAHDNFEATFDLQRGARSARSLRRELLERIYDCRSGQLHEGLRPSYRGVALVSDMGDEVRRGLLADFAEAAILGYLSAPRSSLIGHPGMDPVQPNPTVGAD